MNLTTCVVLAGSGTKRMVSFKPFRKKIVVVTGAASGIGAAICTIFAREGAKVVLLDMNGEDLKARRDELASEGFEAAEYTCDVTSEPECKSVLGEIISQYGGVDVLVNNAGITQRSGFLDTDLSVFRRVMEVNFFGSLNCTKAAMESLVKRRGMIIVMESVAGIAPLLGRTAYSASKHALHGLFTSLRSEVRSAGVHVMIVCPGFVKTNLQVRALDGDGRVTTHPQSKVGKQLSPEAVAEAVYRGAVKRKPLLILSSVGKLTYWLSRLAPVTYERIMARQLKEELER